MTRWVCRSLPMKDGGCVVGEQQLLLRRVETITKNSCSNISPFCFRFLLLRVFHDHPTFPPKNIHIHQCLVYSVFVPMVYLQPPLEITYTRTNTHTHHWNTPYQVHCCFQLSVLVSYWWFFIGMEPIIKPPWHTQTNVVLQCGIFIYVRVNLESTIANSNNTRVRSYDHSLYLLEAQ